MHRNICVCVCVCARARARTHLRGAMRPHTKAIMAFNRRDKRDYLQPLLQQLTRHNPNTRNIHAQHTHTHNKPRRPEALAPGRSLNCSRSHRT